MLQNLLKEQIPIRDLLTVLETLADWAPMTKDLDALTEYARQALSRTITKLYQTSPGNISVITLDQIVETAVAESIQHSEQGGFQAMEPGLAQQIMNDLAKKLENFVPINHQPVVMCSSQIRSYVKRLTDRFIPDLVILSYTDIVGNTKIHSLGTVRIANAN